MSPVSPIPAETLLRMYRLMVGIRLFEERVADLHARGLLPGVAHLSTGQEAVAVGVCEALRREDRITSTHRGHGHCLAKGLRPDRMFAELLGRQAGCCKGKGGSMHLADAETGILGASGIVGGGAGIAAGAAFAAQYLKTDHVTVCFLGEGALGQGVVYEAMNMAQLWRLPVIFVCENNQYSEFTHFSETIAGNILDRPKAFGMAAEAVDGQDVCAAFMVTTKYVERARRGLGPAFIQANTYRYDGHDVGDASRGFYRPASEEEQWRSTRDPIALLGEALVRGGTADAATRAHAREELAREMDQAVAFALESAYPDAGAAAEDVYA